MATDKFLSKNVYKLILHLIAVVIIYMEYNLNFERYYI